MVGWNGEEGCGYDGEEDEADEVLDCYVDAGGDGVVHVVPSGSEDAAQDDGDEIAGLHH